MPTYDYVCDACGHSLEVFQNFNDPLKRKCPECGKNKLQRQFGTGAGIIFKGSGFYQTDYRSESYKKAAEKEKKSSEQKKSGEKSDAPKKSAEKSKSSPKDGKQSA